MTGSRCGWGWRWTLLPGLAESAEPFDFVFIDADKPNNAAYFDWALKLSRPGSIIVVDNVVRDGDVIDAAQRLTDGPGRASLPGTARRRAAGQRHRDPDGRQQGLRRFRDRARDVAFVVCLSPRAPRRIGTARAAAHILPMPLAKPGDSGQTRITGQRAFHQRWERPVATRPHGSLTGAGESHASVLAELALPGLISPGCRLPCRSSSSR